METWKIGDRLSTDLDRVERIVVKIVAGDVTVAAGTTPHIDIVRESGDDVTVELNDGVLYIAQPDPDRAPLDRFFRMITEGSRHRCAVAVTAPPGASIDVTTVSADAVVSGFEGGTRVKTVSGSVTLAELSKEVDVKTVSGDIEAKDIAAGMKLKTVSGGIAVVEGACNWIDAKTVSGDALLDIDLHPTGTYDITTVSGDVAVRTMSEPNLVVDATSVSGGLISDFGLGWESRPGRRRIYETIGSGGARLFVKTVSGDLRVLRGRAA